MCHYVNSFLDFRDEKYTLINIFLMTNHQAVPKCRSIIHDVKRHRVDYFDFFASPKVKRRILLVLLLESFYLHAWPPGTKTIKAKVVVNALDTKYVLFETHRSSCLIKLSYTKGIK